MDENIKLSVKEYKKYYINGLVCDINNRRG